MARSSNGKRGGRRQPRRVDSGRGGRRVLAGRGVIGGEPWELWVPEDMPEDERAAAVERQRALLDQAARASTVATLTRARRRPRRSAIAGALDQLAGAVQLALL